MPELPLRQGALTLSPEVLDTLRALKPLVPDFLIAQFVVQMQMHYTGTWRGKLTPEQVSDVIRKIRHKLTGRAGPGRPKGTKSAGPMRDAWVTLWCKSVFQPEYYRHKLGFYWMSPEQFRDHFKNNVRPTFRRWDKEAEAQRRTAAARKRKRALPKLALVK